METIGGTVVEARGMSYLNAISPVNFKISQGEGFGFLGPQGAGKSKMMGLLSCLLPISQGSLFIGGLDSRNKKKQILARIGVVPQGIILDEDFTPLENLLLFGKYYGIAAARLEERALELIREMGLEEFSDSSVSSLSFAFQRRLMICRALLIEPVVLLLDEPTVGVEPAEQDWIWDLFNRLKRQRGLTVIISSKNRHEIEKVCDRVALMDKGKVIQVGAPAGMIKEVVGPEVLEFYCRRGDLDYYLARLNGRYRFQVFQNKVRLFFREDQEPRGALSYISGEEMIIRRASLDDVFLKLTGQTLQEGYLWR